MQQLAKNKMHLKFYYEQQRRFIEDRREYLSQVG